MNKKKVLPFKWMKIEDKIYEPFYYRKNNKSKWVIEYDRVFPWKNWVCVFKKPYCGHKNCKIETHYISVTTNWLQLEDERDSLYIQANENCIIMQER